MSHLCLLARAFLFGGRLSPVTLQDVWGIRFVCIGIDRTHKLFGIILRQKVMALLLFIDAEQLQVVVHPRVELLGTEA